MPINPSDFTFIQQLVARVAGIVVEAGQEYLIESRLAPLADELGLGSIGDLIAQIRSDPSEELRRRAVEAMTTHETFFFRDDSPFEALKSEVLPQILQRRAGERRLSIWSCACSTGQEPYSIALLLREYVPQVMNWKLELVGTDFSQSALERARQGRYSQLEVDRGLPAILLRKYFEKQGEEWQLTAEIRERVQFRSLNLAHALPSMPPFDVILLRNVMIYFDVPTKRRILGELQRLLKPDGYLMLGTAETTLNLDPAYEQVLHGKSAFYRLRS